MTTYTPSTWEKMASTVAILWCLQGGLYTTREDLDEGVVVCKESGKKAKWTDVVSGDHPYAVT